MPIRANAIITEDELNTIYQEMCLKSRSTQTSATMPTTDIEYAGLNPYEIYIEECKLNRATKVNPQGKRLLGIESHHIIPIFEGGSNEPANLVLLTVKEHVIAHWIRWKVLEKPQDYCAFLFRIGDTEQAFEQRRLAVLAARERDRINQRGFFNQEFQREMGTRGGVVGGSRNSENQYLARQRVGREYGRQTGINNQQDPLRNFIQNFSIWAYSANAATGRRGANRVDEQFYLVSPKNAFVDITNTLNTFVPDSVRQSSSMHKVVYGERKQMYGWRIVNTLTRSEVREGIQDFININPTVSFQFDENLMLVEGLE